MQKEIDYRQLGMRVKEIRQNRGITQDSLAAMITSAISQILKTAIQKQALTRSCLSQMP